jgi:peptide/nickel transport system permease protein
VSAIPATDPPILFTRERGPAATLFITAWRQGRTKLGVALTGVVVLVALLGPLVTPHSPYTFIGQPFQGSSGSAVLGTDYLGRDVLSQFLAGGRRILALSAVATLIGVGLGVAIGLTAAYSRAFWDNLLMRIMDVILAFPAIILALLLISTLGPSFSLLALGVALTNMPRVARVIRGAGVEVVQKDFVAAASAMGIPSSRVILREVLPNVVSPLMVELSLRFTYTIALVASLFFLGFDPNPGTADWGLMINANRVGLAQQPLAVLIGVCAIAILTIGTSMIGDGFARAAIGIERSTGHR